MTEEVVEMPSSDVLSSDEMKAKSAKSVQNALEITVSSHQTYLIVVARNKKNEKNSITRINCKKGLPIAGYTYDSQSDSYFIDCSDYLQLGCIPVSFSANMKGSNSWTARIPMPESVIKKYLTDLQKKELSNFKSHFKSEEYDLEYIQMIDPN
jgi:hypothetical protein